MENAKPCPVQAQAVVSVMGGKWKPGILFRLQSGPFRFGELKRQMPWISEKVLIRQLKELEESGVAGRRDCAEVPPRVDYSLTPHGKTLGPLLMTLAACGKGISVILQSDFRRTGRAFGCSTVQTVLLSSAPACSRSQPRNTAASGCSDPAWVEMR
jgi:DNA-binding HxlR family transcriptional regulator